MKILIAEDQAASAHSLRRVLERLGHEALVATGAEAAWDQVLRGNVSVLITDWEMPGFDGPELCRRVRGLGSHPYHYVILVTSRGTREDRLAGLRAGADDFLSKPVDPDELCVRLDIARRILDVHEALARKNAMLAELATTDPLTGVRNRRRFHEDLDAHVALSSRTEMPLSLIMLDVDHFKRYNDAFGHPAGDEVLRRVARLLRAGVRDHDTVARFGGEEFAILLPSAGPDLARVIAERLRRSIAEHNFPRQPITVSLGVSTLDLRMPDAERLIEGADRALYRSKDGGRNRVTHVADGLISLPAAGDRVTPRAPAALLGEVLAQDHLARKKWAPAPFPPDALGVLIPWPYDLNQAGGLDHAQIFVRAEDPNDPWLLTTWRDSQDFDAWRLTRRETLMIMAGDPSIRPFQAWIRLPDRHVTMDSPPSFPPKLLGLGSPAPH